MEGGLQGAEQRRSGAFDRLCDRAEFHTSAAVYMTPPWPLEKILLATYLEHEKMLIDILSRLKEKGARVKQTTSA